MGARSFHLKKYKLHAALPLKKLIVDLLAYETQ